MTGALRANDGELLRDAAVACLGLNLPDFVAANALAGGQLLALLEALSPAAFALYGLYPQDRQPSLPVRAFMNFVVERSADATA